MSKYCNRSNRAVRLGVICSLLFVFAGAATGHAGAQEDDRPPRIEMPSSGDSADKFVPRGWRIETETDDTLVGDLNGDGRPDRLLRLVQDVPAETPDGVFTTRFRALAVLFGAPGGAYKRAAVTTRLLLCSTCAGVRGDPSGGGNIQIRIERGVIVVEQQSGSRFAYSHTLRLRYERETNRFLLIGEDFDNRDTATGDRTEESSNYLTGVRLIRTYRYDRRRDAEALASTKTARITRQRKFLEDIDSNNP